MCQKLGKSSHGENRPKFFDFETDLISRYEDFIVPEISSSKKIASISELLYSESVKTKRENGRASFLPIKYMGKDYRWTFDQYDHGRKRRVCQIN